MFFLQCLHSLIVQQLLQSKTFLDIIAHTIWDKSFYLKQNLWCLINSAEQIMCVGKCLGSINVYTQKATQSFFLKLRHQNSNPFTVLIVKRRQSKNPRSVCFSGVNSGIIMELVMSVIDNTFMFEDNNWKSLVVLKNFRNMIWDIWQHPSQAKWVKV